MTRADLAARMLEALIHARGRVEKDDGLFAAPGPSSADALTDSAVLLADRLLEKLGDQEEPPARPTLVPAPCQHGDDLMTEERLHRALDAIKGLVPNQEGAEYVAGWEAAVTAVLTEIGLVE